MHKSVKNRQLKKTPSYGRIDISTIGGIFMPREYRHIEQYAKEIAELQNKGFSQKQIGEKLGFSKNQVKSYIHRLHQKERKIAVGILSLLYR